MTVPSSPSTSGSNIPDATIIEQVLRTVFPEDVEILGDDHIRDIAGNPTKIREPRHPELPGEQFDLVAIFDILRDAAVIASSGLVIYRSMQSTTPAPPRKDDVKKSLDKRLKDQNISANALSNVDKIIGALVDILHHS